MTSYETCIACHARECFGDGPCTKCTPSQLKNSSIQEPYYISLAKFYGGIKQ